MTAKRAAATQATLTRAIRAALAAGLKAGEFDIKAEGDQIIILTHPAAEGVASGDQGEDAWRERMAKWRRSA